MQMDKTHYLAHQAKVEARVLRQAHDLYKPASLAQNSLDPWKLSHMIVWQRFLF
jgi:hypothetical protein